MQLLIQVFKWASDYFSDIHIYLCDALLYRSQLRSHLERRHGSAHSIKGKYLKFISSLPSDTNIESRRYMSPSQVVLPFEICANTVQQLCRYNTWVNIIVFIYNSSRENTCCNYKMNRALYHGLNYNGINVCKNTNECDVECSCVFICTSQGYKLCEVHIQNCKLNVSKNNCYAL